RRGPSVASREVLKAVRKKLQCAVKEVALGIDHSESRRRRRKLDERFEDQEGKHGLARTHATGDKAVGPHHLFKRQSYRLAPGRRPDGYLWARLGIEATQEFCCSLARLA